MRLAIFAILVLSYLSFADDTEKLLLAIEQVESNGKVNAVGDGGKALGCLQIHKCVVDDVNLILKKKVYTYQDRSDKAKSFEMARIYLNHYGSRMTTMDKARIWNGGPAGYKKAATLKYWHKVKRAMK